MGKVHNLMKQVEDRESFLTFVDALAADWEDRIEREGIARWHPAPHGWENGTIGDFLGASVRWARDWMKQETVEEPSSKRAARPVSVETRERPGLPEEPSWKAFAKFLAAGKVYE